MLSRTPIADTKPSYLFRLSSRDIIWGKSFMFDSEYCNIKYIGKDNAVLLTWKKFCCGDNYRKPLESALEIFRNNPSTDFVVDARNGFEDEAEDVEWGFSVFIPMLAATGCITVVFIMDTVTGIEEEMDMWTKEFMKYCTVLRAVSYEDAVRQLSGQKSML